MVQTLKDIDDVLRIISDESCFLSAKDDSDVTPLDITVTILRDPQYLVVKPHEDTLFLFKRVNQVTYEMHVMIVKGPARNKGTQSALKAARWLFKETGCKKLISYIPEFHAPSLMYAKVCGLKQEGWLKGAYLKDGKLFDLVVLGATKRDLEKIYSEEF
jgi:hypothetical protein